MRTFIFRVEQLKFNNVRVFIYVKESKKVGNDVNLTEKRAGTLILTVDEWIEFERMLFTGFRESAEVIR